MGEMKNDEETTRSNPFGADRGEPPTKGDS